MMARFSFMTGTATSASNQSEDETRLRAGEKKKGQGDLGAFGFRQLSRM
jgi:hypothetical protein